MTRRTSLGRPRTGTRTSGCAGRPARSLIRAFLLASFILGCDRATSVRVDTLRVDHPPAPGRVDTVLRVDSVPVIRWRYDTTIVTRPETVTVTRPGRPDTVIVRPTPDTVLVPVKPDTVWAYHVDTLYRTDTLWRQPPPGPAAFVCLYLIESGLPIRPLTYDKPFCGAGHFELDTIGMRTHAGPPPSPIRIPRATLILPSWRSTH